MDDSNPAGSIPDWLIAGETEAEQLALATGVYQELRGIAGRLMSGERDDHTLQATDLVHEAYLSLRARGGIDPGKEESRGRFLSFAARVMRRLLVDHARSRASLKRGGRARQVALDEVLQHLPGLTQDLSSVDAVLEKLMQRDSRKGRIVELRFFAGCSIQETAATLGISHTTVEREWKFSKAWLAAELDRTA